MIANLIGDQTSMGDCIVNQLNSGNFDKIRMMVAFAKQSAIGRINTHLMNFVNAGGRIESIVGIDHHITSYQAIEQLKRLSSNNIYIHYDRGVCDFHPKLYIFEQHRNIIKVLVGSSNLTQGGLYINYEANVLLESTDNDQDSDFVDEINAYYNSLKNDSNTLKATSALLKLLHQQGYLIDETQTSSFRNIVGRTTNLPFRGSRRRVRMPHQTISTQSTGIRLPRRFAMQLSGFDVSHRSQDPVVLIPIKALSMYPLFWQWPVLFTLSHTGYPERYSIAKVMLPNTQPRREHIRIYYYDRKREFRLQCESIKRNGTQGDIMVVERANTSAIEYNIYLIPQGTSGYKRYSSMCTTRVSSLKTFGYG